MINHKGLMGAIGALVALISSAWMPNNQVQAALFNPPPGRSTPSEATGGASRGSFFTPKGNGGVNEATGGASRGSFFTPKGNGGVNEATGGASRGSFFTPAPSRRTVREATGGASRGNTLFTPKGQRRIIRESTGGASRGTIFRRSRGKSIVKESTGGGSRVGVYHLNPTTISNGTPDALIAVLPQTYSGTTLSERPTIQVYIPASEAKSAVFSLQDANGNVQYQTRLAVADKAGVISIRLPENAPALRLGENYQWFLALEIDQELSPRTPYVDGWVQRIAPTPELTAALQNPDAMKRAEALGQNGLWYDCAAAMAQLRLTQPDNATVSQEWRELLEAVDLKDIVKAPIVAAL
jgi:hypothetical protein